MDESQNSNQYAEELLAWYDKHHRPLPWRQNINIYHTWVCEVMSQQTTLAVVIPKFSEFVKQLPTVYDLATCNEDTLRQLWSGLGYYARARNLKKGAVFIVEHLEGRFPQSYNEWLKIPGCGLYTAAVIASVCFHEKVACVDGNVTRVVSRLLALSKDVWSSSGQSVIRDFANSTISAERPGDFNQAMMELGATVCRKTKPLCLLCPLRSQCLASQRNCTELCPPQKPRRDAVDVELFALIIWRKSTDTIIFIERTKGFLANTVGFPLMSEIEVLEVKTTLKSLAQLQLVELPGTFAHNITHHRISGKALVVRVLEDSKSAAMEDLCQKLGLPQPFYWVENQAIATKLSTSLDKKIFKLFQIKQNYSNPI
ncbi:A/G-specific adenine glycosylase [Scytonema sp. UIC 10036]|uniref:A/G-specific adenine glycosylase n=1 Tax=Scytonema sp. UIC 10036 TaxID=2304196 RepID=UPI0012DAA2D6|nr:A/G-specific adenine glycosylase [Scytonema sp. UIC 10036]MUG91982.1 A/G-specific adenine glycosylase [Scytonema sp. UIC 10036]